MSVRNLALAAVSLALAATAVTAEKAKAEDSIFFPVLVYRTGPYAPNGIPIANGVVDIFKYTNAKGGVNGVTIEWEECETGYNTKRGVECYERLKSKNPLIVFPYSTGITYQLIPKAPEDKIVVYSMGYGRTDASDGRVFPWVFTAPTTYWSQASAFIKYVAEQEGGEDNLKGKKLALIYHNSAYGKEPIPTLETLAEEYGYELTLLAVDHPGQEQKSTWLQIRRLKPDWIFLWGWGVMNQVAIKEASNIGYDMEKMIGVWWSGAEQDVVPTGAAATGYKAGTFHAPGADFPLHEDLLKVVYEAGNGTGEAEDVGSVLWNRGMYNGLIALEAIRTAQAETGKKVIDGEDMRWGMENLNITAERLKELGLEGFAKPMSVSCADHEGNGPVLIQQWDGKRWQIVSDFIEPMRDVVRPMIEESAANYAEENKITPRDCSA